MNAEFNFKTLAEFMGHFHDEATCVNHFTATRFANGAYCPYCGNKQVYAFRGGKRYRCAGCKEDFTIKTGTLFGESKLPLRKWFICIYLLSTTSKGMSSVQLAKHVGVTQKTAWFMAHRIRAAKKQGTIKIKRTVEADETYIGGRAKNMHASKRKASGVGTGGLGKIAVFGVRERGGEVRTAIIPENDSKTLHPLIRANVETGATLYTDEHRGYNGLGYEYVRNIIRHGLKQYVVGDCHTNGIESFWALFKRGYHGVYHQMSRKHLQRYLNEFSFRLNRKERKMTEVFSDVVGGIANTDQLPQQGF